MVDFGFCLLGFEIAMNLGVVGVLTNHVFGLYKFLANLLLWPNPIHVGEWIIDFNLVEIRFVLDYGEKFWFCFGNMRLKVG